MKIFVTGGAGFVGTHLVKDLLQKGTEVTIFDNLKNKSKNQATFLQEIGASFIRSDVTNYASLSKAIVGSDCVIHLAAEINVQDSIRFPQKTNHINVDGTVNLLRSCVEKKIKNIITASSAAVYGNQKDLPLSENSETLPISPYGASKLAIEHYMQAFSNCYGLNCVTLRFFNAYGKGQTGSYAGVITKFMENIRLGKPLVIYGDGYNTRDFVSVDDIVQSINNAIKKIEGKKGNFYNIASGKYVTIKELAKMMIAISGKKLDIKYKSLLEGDIKHSQASIKLAKKELGYEPRVKLKDGLKKLLES